MADDDSGSSLTGSLMGAALGVGLIGGAPSVLHGLGAFEKAPQVSMGSVLAGAAAGAVLGYIAGHEISRRRRQAREAAADSQGAKQWAASVSEPSCAKSAEPGI